MVREIVSQTLLTPHNTLEGWQDGANSIAVSGWAWDRASPERALAVDVFDGTTLLATITADRYRRDLRDAGIGDGCHAFVYPLEGHIRGRTCHPITVRIAGTNVALRDVVTGAMPRPVSRRDRLKPPPVAHFSMSPIRRWFSYSCLRVLLRALPFPVWRLPAMLLGIVHLMLDRKGRALDLALLRALGRPTAPGDRVRMHWSRAYQRQANLLLIVQADRIASCRTERWVRFGGALPPDGAILISVHHDAGWLAARTFAARGYLLGMITSVPRDPVALAGTDATLRAHWRAIEASDARDFGDRRFSRGEAGRKGLRLLAAGGYLMVDVDEFARQAPFSPVLGRAMTVPRGALWFARRSGKPIIPYMVVPEGWHWRLWVGEPVAPTQEGMCAAMEACIRQAPESWQRFMAMAWMEAPRWDGVDSRHDA